MRNNEFIFGKLREVNVPKLIQALKAAGFRRAKYHKETFMTDAFIRITPRTDVQICQDGQLMVSTDLKNGSVQFFPPRRSHLRVIADLQSMAKL